MSEPEATTSAIERVTPQLVQPTSNKRRVIILGASNVARSFSTLVATARSISQGPLEIVAAHGRGRSYGTAWSAVLMRKLPGILSCGLWDAIRESNAPSSALVTDIGNDLLYEHSVATIAGWVEQCLDRLATRSAQTIITSLPIENILGISEARYKFFRNLFVPGCSLGLREVESRARELDERVRALATSRSMTVVAPQRSWYGHDPIHIRIKHYPKAWCEVLGSWQSTPEMSRFSRGKWRESIYLNTRLPARVRWFNRELRAVEPCVRLSDGTTIALY